MAEFSTTRIMPFTPEQMFDLVADVEKYPLFVPMCKSLTVKSLNEEAGKTYLVAEMAVAYNLIRQAFTCRVTLDKGAQKIEVDYLSGPFKRLENIWNFKPHEKGCEVDFFIEYEFKSVTLSVIASVIMDKSFKMFAQAFEERAKKVYLNP